jgi:methionyl-tRNA formyltransferase
MDARKLRIVFMGTPEFAAEILKELVAEAFNIVGVVTVPDKPAGRGQKLNESEVKKYAHTQNIKILQPEKLKNEVFIEELKSLKPDLNIVVAFRMLPEIVWNMPKLGTFNLHASLLPQYRGAAPINWAIINGETKTGLTSFLIDKEIDTGKILLKKEIEINLTDNAGDLHDRMIPHGAKLVIDTIETIANDQYKAIPQEKLIANITDLKSAPKIFKNDCRINWQMEGMKIYNFIRGLSPFPAAWTEIKRPEDEKFITLKIFESEWLQNTHNEIVGTIKADKKNLLIAIKDGFISVKNLQLEGKKRLNIEEFLRGFKIQNHSVH